MPRIIRTGQDNSVRSFHSSTFAVTEHVRQRASSIISPPLTLMRQKAKMRARPWPYSRFELRADLLPMWRKRTPLFA